MQCNKFYKNDVRNPSYAFMKGATFWRIQKRFDRGIKNLTETERKGQC